MFVNNFISFIAKSVLLIMVFKRFVHNCYYYIEMSFKKMSFIFLNNNIKL